MVNEDRQKALVSVDEKIFELYTSVETGRAISNLNRKYHLIDGGDHIDVIGDVILGFYPKIELEQKLIQEARLTPEIAAAVTADLRELLAPVPGPAPLPKGTSDLKERLHLRPLEQEKEAETPKPITREEIIASLSPKRTMAGDIAAAQGKTADGDGEEKPEKSAPTKEPAPGLRWDSEK